MIGVFGRVFLKIVAASAPFRPGIERSSIIKSGRVCLAFQRHQFRPQLPELRVPHGGAQAEILLIDASTLGHQQSARSLATNQLDLVLRPLQLGKLRSTRARLPLHSSHPANLQLLVAAQHTEPG